MWHCEEKYQYCCTFFIGCASGQAAWFFNEKVLLSGPQQLHEQYDLNVGQGSGAGHCETALLIAHSIYRNASERARSCVSGGVERLCYLSPSVSLTS